MTPANRRVPTGTLTRRDENGRKVSPFPGPDNYAAMFPQVALNGGC